ncbi:carbamoyltransferase HypF [Verrucomicrobiota bacterium sgz303538]
MNRERARVVVHGAVQGVGFRPFVYRLATQLGLDGWVQNSAQGVVIEIEGKREAVERFVVRLEKERPPHAVIHGMETAWFDAAGHCGFEIRPSATHGAKTACILPDIATCSDCLREIFDPANRRYRYPFTNCTHCGPRFSIVEALPYDRQNTTMKRFAMCSECEREYHDPHNRRFHAQPNACPQCGPQLALWDANGTAIALRDSALREATESVRSGRILALKGIGGFQLIVDAGNEAAIARLRARKRREEKPFALMVPSLEGARELCCISELEERLLLSPEAPIVLLKQHSAFRDSGAAIAEAIAPGNPSLGVMLPYTPLHHLLLRELGFPVVATSGNLSDEPICTDEHEALARLTDIADFFLIHDRPIARHVDDSIVRVMCGREMVLRRARGYAPLPVRMRESQPATLAVGAHMKSSIALSAGNDVFISQHIGDLAAGPAWWAFRRVVSDMQRLFEVTPEVVGHDLHPDYLSTKYAAQTAAPCCPVQHHWAHVLACMADNDLTTPVLGVAWDGTGYGPDGTIWGGEFLLANNGTFERVAHLRTFRLPGGDAAVKEPRRTALGVLHELWGGEALHQSDLAPISAFTKGELTLLEQMLVRGFNAPHTSSAGRLFDAVAAILGLRQRATFEGQAAMELEFSVEPESIATYPFELTNGRPRVIDWRPTIAAIVNDLRCKVPAGIISARFHETLAEMVVAVARVVGEPKVVLTGGCFQNEYLTNRCVERLRDAGFRAYWHQRVPPNDGGIALGQVMAARAWNPPSRQAPEPSTSEATAEPLCV